MPRQRKTAAGYPALARPPVAGQTYGNAADQQQLDQSMPTPNVHNPGSPAVIAGRQVAQGARQGVYDVNAARNAATGTTDIGLGALTYDHQAVMGAAQQMAGDTGVLQRPTDRPNEPVTTGLARGPGAGPEVLGAMRGSPTGDMLRRLSAELGDPYFADLAARARA